MLPKELQNVIIDTKVVSGYGKLDKYNFISTDKLYLLSAREVFVNSSGKTNISQYDTAYNTTRQLDYYELNNVTGDDTYYASKPLIITGMQKQWWLRTANSNYSDDFLLVRPYGELGYSNSSFVYSVPPAFRIG